MRKRDIWTSGHLLIATGLYDALGTAVAIASVIGAAAIVAYRVAGRVRRHLTGGELWSFVACCAAGSFLFTLFPTLIMVLVLGRSYPIDALSFAIDAVSFAAATLFLVRITFNMFIRAKRKALSCDSFCWRNRFGRALLNFA